MQFAFFSIEEFRVNAVCILGLSDNVIEINSLLTPIIFWNLSSCQPRNDITTTHFDFFPRPLHCPNILESTDHSLLSIFEKKNVVISLPGCRDAMFVEKSDY
jgi:hypothetical protein